MQARRYETDDERALLASVHELQRAAGKVLRHAGGGGCTRTLSTALAHVEEALDRLSVAMLQLERAAVDSRQRATGVGGSHPRPEAEALRRYLRAVADELCSAELACQAGRKSARRLVEPELTHAYGAKAPCGVIPGRA